VQQHTVQRILKGPNAGKYVYTGGNRRIGRFSECCEGRFGDEGVGHGTPEEAYAHMRERLLAKLRLDVRFGDWSGCAAPWRDRTCDRPTKDGAEIPPMYFLEPLCGEHRNRETVEAMWKGPGDWAGSW